MANTKVVTGKVRFSYAYLFEPQPSFSGGDPKYSVTLLIPKSDTETLTAIKNAMQAARDNFCAKNGANALPVQFNHTMHDGDGLRDSGEPYGDECKGHYVITVSTKNKPAIVDNMCQPILDSSAVYSGCYGRAAINFYAYSVNGKKGVTAGLQSVQKLCDGEHFGSVGSANDFNDGFKDPDAAANDDFFN